MLSLSVFSQNVIVTGKADGQADKLVRIITYDDLFSNLEKTIATTKTDESGDFAMKFELQETQFAYFALGIEKGECYLSPNSSYLIDIPKVDRNENASVFDRVPLRFTTLPDDGGIQKSIEDFNIDYNDFLYNNVNKIYKSKDKSTVVNFVNLMKDKYAKVDQKYVRNYVDYSLASLLWLSKKNSNKKTLTEYIIGKPVLYSNIQYVEFFKEFFKNYFESEKTFRYEELIPAINEKGSMLALAALISRDSLVGQDIRVSELATMLMLSRYYFNRYVEKDLVIEKLKRISALSQFEENKKIASNFIIKLQELQTGTRAPVIELTASDGSIVSLEDYKGSFVLLSFVKNECRMCEFHMKLLSDLSDSLDFKILTIVAGDSSDNVESFAKERNFDWPILRTGENILLLEDYNIKVYPSYIFINPDGTIAYVHLPMPEENMELYLQRFMERYKSENGKMITE